MIHLEGIIGAFLSGIAVRRALGSTESGGALDIVSRAIFIPAFFLGAGFLIDLPVFGRSIVSSPLLIVGFVGALFSGKFIAAWLAGSILRYGKDKRLMFALSLPQVAATLAVALVAYNSVNQSGQRLLDQPLLNATVVLVIVSSLAGLVLVDRYCRN